MFEVSASYLGLSVADVVLTLEDLLDKQFVSSLLWSEHQEVDGN